MNNTEMQLAAALKIIQNMLDKKPRAEQEAATFIKQPDMPTPQRFRLEVAKSDHSLPGFAAYIAPADIVDGIPVGHVLLNLDCILWVCVDQSEIPWDEFASECIGHECFHALQDILGRELEEYHIQEQIDKTREEGLSGFEPQLLPWQDTLDLAMINANPDSIVVFVDPTHPSANLALRKTMQPTQSTQSGEPILTPEWETVEMSDLPPQLSEHLKGLKNESK